MIAWLNLCKLQAVKRKCRNLIMFEDHTIALKATDVLARDYGIIATPGRKARCPYCGHHTMQVNSSNEFAYCFHPHCGRSVSACETNQHQIGVVENLLASIQQRARETLFAQRAEANGNTNGYSYLVDERQIHPDILGMLAIGVVPADLFANLFQEADSALQAQISKTENKKKGHPTKEHQKIEKALQNELEEIEVLRRTISMTKEWVAFFYTDARLRIKSIRFR